LTRFSNLIDVSLIFNKLSAISLSYNKLIKAEKIRLHNQSSEKCEVKIACRRQDLEGCSGLKKELSGNLQYKSYKFSVVQHD
jgi:hypothetical protein